ncbi:MAG: alanine racemase [Nitrospirae bacterium]|nr:alanine racemase [Nitrospirota bacterium]
MNRGPSAEIDLSAFAHNIAVLRNVTGDRPVIAVVKADAYGHGSVEVSRRLLREGVSMLAVAFTGEARKLRDSGIAAPILVLFDRDELNDYFELGLTPVIQDIRTADVFSKEAVSRGKKIRVHIKIDTGMGRIGFRPEQAVSDAVRVADMKGIELEGLMSHFSEADLTDRSYAMHQIQIFDGITKELSARLHRPLICHMANSAASLSIPEALFEAVRPGLLLYGHSPFEERYGLKPVMTIKTKLLAVRNLPAGCAISYGRTFCTLRPSRIGVVPIGYADGYNRLFSNNAEMLVRGRRVPVAGRVCMDLTMVDVTEVEDVSEGDEVVILGRQADETVRASELSAKIGTIPYEILISLGCRARRSYLN